MLSPVVLVVPFNSVKNLRPEEPLEASCIEDALKEAQGLASYYEGVGVYVVMVDTSNYDAASQPIEVAAFGEVPEIDIKSIANAA